MSFPDLTPTSTQSAITLPVTSSDTSAVITGSLAVGFYNTTAFVSGAMAQVAYTYKRLGGDVLDIELTAKNIYNHYEEACLEYSYIVNLHQARNALGSALGSATGSFDHTGDLTDGTDAALKYPKFQFDYAFRAADKFSTEAGVGGTEPIYSGSITTVNDQADYDLQSIVSASAVDPANSAYPYYNKVGDKRIFIKKVYYRTPYAVWRFYGYYGGLNVVGNFSNYGQYTDDSSFDVIPAWHNKMQAISYEDHLYTRTSHYSYEIHDNKLRLYPIPTSVSPEKFWIRFTIKTGPFEDEGNNAEGLNGVNNMSNLPFENIAFNTINSIGKQWIRRFSLALSKETLGQVRGKFGGAVPIPGDNISLNASDLLSQAKEEQNALRDELKTVLDEMTYDKIMEKEAAMGENSMKTQEKSPLPVFVG